MLALLLLLIVVVLLVKVTVKPASGQTYVSVLLAKVNLVYQWAVSKISKKVVK